jgi:hypothetical protein
MWIPAGRGSVYLAWSGPRDPALRYHVYREDGRGRVRVTSSPQSAASYLDSGLDGAGSVTYRVTAVDAQGCESADSPAAVVAPSGRNKTGRREADQFGSFSHRRRLQSTWRQGCSSKPIRSITDTRLVLDLPSRQARALASPMMWAKRVPPQLTRHLRKAGMGVG